MGDEENLRHKENFMILEGFLSELLGFDVTIENILESEGNFVGKYKKDIFKPTKHQKEKFNIETVADIFPKS